MREEQPDNLRLLSARLVTSTAGATGRLNRKMQRSGAASIDLPRVCPVLEEQAHGRSAACPNCAMQRSNAGAIGGIRIRSGGQQALDGRSLSSRIPVR